MGTSGERRFAERRCQPIPFADHRETMTVSTSQTFRRAASVSVAQASASTLLRPSQSAASPDQASPAHHVDPVLAPEHLCRVDRVRARRADLVRQRRRPAGRDCDGPGPRGVRDGGGEEVAHARAAVESRDWECIVGRRGRRGTERGAGREYGGVRGGRRRVEGGDSGCGRRCRRAAR